MRPEKSKDASNLLRSKAPKRFVYRLYLAITWFFMKLLYRVRFIRDVRITKENGPYFIVGNHVSFLDPIFCLLALNKLSVRFVAGEEVTSGKLLKPLIAPLSVILIKPFRVNFSTTREIICSIKSNISVALFPETQRSISGDLTPFGLSTAKLIKHLGVPVASVFARGGYLGWPRWAKMLRPGHIEMETQLLFTKEETKQLSVDDIQRRLVKAMATEDYDWQLRRKRPVRYLSLKPAQGLAKICHWCPACDQPLSMKSGKRVVSCKSCGQTFRIDATGFFSASPGSKPFFDHPLEYAQWQRLRTMKALEEGLVLSDRCNLEFRENVEDDTLKHEKPFRKGVCKLVEEGLLFTDEEGSQPLMFPLGDTPSLYTSIGHYADVLSGANVWRLYPESEGFTTVMTDYSRVTWEKKNDFAQYVDDVETT